MKRNFLYISLIASSALALTACTNDDNAANNNTDNIGKTPIELSVGVADAAATSRAITVDPTSPLTASAFAEATDLYLVMKSEAESKTAMWTMTKGNVAAGASEVTFGNGFKRYWDDCYSRDAHLSVYGVCTPSGTPVVPTISGSSTYPYTNTPTTGAWTETANSLTIANWSVKNDQGELTAATFADQDLCYSNNISKWSEAEGEDKRLKFDTGTKKFTGGNMNFYHALSKITFVVQHNETFKDEEFKFADGTNISMKGMNIKNSSFDIATGEFSSAEGAYTTGEITKMYQRSFADGKYTLDALVLPGTDMSDATANTISFIIANNLYQLSKKDLFDKISDDDKSNKMLENKKLKPGVNYIFTLNISKTQIIKITAKVVDWEVVNADPLTPSNARLKIETSSLGNEMTNNFDLYRLLDTDNTTIDTRESYDWTTGYTDKNTVTYNSSATGADKWKLASDWYWDNNMTYYHFRTVSPSNTPITDEKSVALESNEPTATDIIWGAPFVSGLTKVTYSTDNGFDGTSPHQIYYAIGPTNDAINLTMFHVMSKVKFNIKTTDGDDKVTLKDGEKNTTITLKSINKNGNVAMGNGLVSATSTNEDWTFTQTPTYADNKYSWSAGIVPQSLEDVILVITTPDGNQYEVELKEVKAQTVTANNISISGVEANKEITYWYPSFDYTYTITLKKTGIEKITATLVDWQSVSAENQDVQIK